jgi:uncharacterized membrane protein YhaH (DUF805 family)
MKWYIDVLKKYAVFNGRARRKEYWMFMLITTIVAFALGTIEGIVGIASETDASVFGALYQLATVVPTIAVGVRRMHDTDHSGWWLLVPFANLVLALRQGQRGSNRFGSDPISGPSVGQQFPEATHTWA